jgi:hypothetical protein
MIMASFRTFLLMLGPLVSLSCATMTYGDELLKLTPGLATIVQVAGADKGKFTSIIGDPAIADVVFGPHNTFMFVGKKEGITNIVVLNDDNAAEIYRARIEVGDVDRVKIYNKALLTSFTSYRCTPDCEYVNEVTAAEPAPLPKGYSNQNIQSSTASNQNIQSSETFQSNTNQLPSSPATRFTRP